MNIEDLKAVVRNYGLQAEVLRDLCGVPQEIIEAAERGDKREFPCPKCGGKTRFRIYDLERGSVGCSHCCKNKDDGSGDIIGAVMWALGLSSEGEAKRELEKWLIERGYVNEPRGYKQGGKRLTTTTKTTTKQTQEHDADETLTLTASGVEYEDDNVSRRLVKTTFYHRFNPRSNFISTLRRDDYDAPKPDNKKTKWVQLEKDAQGNSVYAPYIAGAATATNNPPKDALERLWDEVFTTQRLYIVEGEKCAESLKNALKSTPYDGAVLTLGASGNAHLWSIWAPFLKRKNPNAEVVIFADNDAPGRKAANETANAFHAAKFKKISVVDFSQDRDGDDGYDVADYLAEGNDVALLLDDANGYVMPYDERLFFASLADNEIDEKAAIENRYKRELSREERRLRLELENESLTSFDFKRLQNRTSFFDYALALADKYHVDPMAELFPFLTLFVNFTGQKIAVHEPLIHNRPKQVLFPRLCTVLLGSSNSGKSPIIKENAIVPIEEIEIEENVRLAERQRNGEEVPRPPRFLIASSSGQNLDVKVGELQSNGYWNGGSVVNDEASAVFSLSNDIRGEFTRFQFYTDLAEPAGTLANYSTNTTLNVASLNLKSRLTVGYLFGVQPKTFGAYLKHTLLREQGFPNRFFKFYLPSKRTKEKDVFIDPTLYDQYAAPYRWLYELPRIDDEPYIFTLNEAAREVFKQYRDYAATRKDQLEDQGLPDEAAFLGKTDAYVLSIAAGLKVLELAKVIPNGIALTPETLKRYGFDLNIDRETMQIAVDLAMSAIDKTLAAMRVVRLAAETNDAEERTEINEVDQSVLKIIREAGEKGATTSPMRQNLNAFKGPKGKTKLEATLKKLLAAGYIRSDGKANKWGSRYFIVDFPKDVAETT